MTYSPPASAVAPSSSSTFAHLFGIDLRSLALFRVALGSIVLLDLFSRARYLTAHYTDAGVVPRAALNAYLLQPTQWTFHVLGGSAAFQAALFILAGVFAVAVIFGYRTRWAIVLTWAFAASLQYRNPMVNNSGDMLLRVLLFWSMFLPLGARWSVDAAVDGRESPLPRRVANMASAALLLQVCIVYWFTAALKSDPVWRSDHTAVYYALSIEQFVTPLGKLIYPWPGLMKALTISTLYLEIIGPALVFLPVWTARFRLAMILAFFALHAGFGISMRLGFFPWISAVSWLPFLPSEFWDRLHARLRTPERLGLRLYIDGECGFCRRLARVVHTFLLLPETPILPAQSDPSIHDDMKRMNSWVIIDARGTRHFRFDAVRTVLRLSPFAFWLAPLLALPPIAAVGNRLYEFVAARRHRTGIIVRLLAPRPLAIDLPCPANVAAALLFAYVVVWNFRSLGAAPDRELLPPWLEPVGYVTTLAQCWDMFAPAPLSDDGWYVLPATLQDGSEVDIFRGGAPLTWDKPAWVVDDYPSQRWRKYHMTLYREAYRALWRPYAQYRCWDWNRRHEPDRQLDALDVYFMEEQTLPDYRTAPVQKRLLYAHRNLPEGAERPAPATLPSPTDPREPSR